MFCRVAHPNGSRHTEIAKEKHRGLPGICDSHR